MNWLRHAFAVEPDGPAGPTAAERALVERLCRAVVRRRLTAPALVLLEVGRPMSYLAAQGMHFFAPLAAAVFDAESYGRFAAFLERRGSIDYLCRQLESMEAERDEAPRS